MSFVVAATILPTKAWVNVASDRVTLTVGVIKSTMQVLHCSNYIFLCHISESKTPSYLLLRVKVHKVHPIVGLNKNGAASLRVRRTLWASLSSTFLM